MSISYWVAKKFGVLIVLFYLAVMGILVVTHYRTGVAETPALALAYPPGRYESSDKYQTVREIYGFPPELEERLAAKGDIQVLSYTDDAVVIQRAGKNPETVPADDVIKYLANRRTSTVESYIAPLNRPLTELMDLHLAFMQRVERAVGGETSGWRSLIIPKIVISGVYLGIVCVIMFILRRVDANSKKYKGGFSLVYGGFIMWPIAMIIVSFAGSSVVDVVRHMPDSYYFMRPHVLGGWAAMFAWPVLLAALCIFDIIHAALRVNMNSALAHAAVLAAGIVSIPVVTVGVLFAILSVVLYIGYKMTKKLVLPSSLQARRK